MELIDINRRGPESISATKRGYPSTTRSSADSCGPAEPGEDPGSRSGEFVILKSEKPGGTQG